MENLYAEFLLALQNHDKEKAVNLCIKALEDERIDIINLYENILTKALNNVIYEFENNNKLIWQEHLRSEIIITIIENCYLYALKERDKRGIKRKERVLVLCPSLEEHDIGARMAADIFTIAGFDTLFLGANTPWKTIIKSIKAKNIDIVSIGVSNFYNVLEVKSTIKMIRANFDFPIKFILGGHAFKGPKEMYKEIGGDIYLEKLEDIFSLEEEVDEDEIILEDSTKVSKI